MTVAAVVRELNLPEQLDLDASVIEPHARLQNHAHSALDRLLTAEQKQLLGRRVCLALDERFWVRRLVVELDFNVGRRTKAKEARLELELCHAHAQEQRNC